MITTTDFAKYLSRFLSEYLPHDRNYSPNTIASYRDAFVQYIDNMKDIKGISVEKLQLKYLAKDTVVEYLRWLVDIKKYSPVTRNHRLAALHSFCVYLQYTVIDRMEEWQKILSIKALRTERNSLNYLSKEGIKLLLEQPYTSTWRGRRNLALLALMYDTGARVSEIVNLTVNSVRINYEPYTIRLYGKGRKARIVPLVKEQVSILKEYMEENKLNESAKESFPLFYNTKHEKLTREGITYILNMYVKMARIVSPELIPNKISCHSIRHSRAMHLLQAGVNLVYIRDLLGHVSIQTTDIYARAESKAKQEALEKAYTKLTPNQTSDKIWERNMNLRDWLRSLKDC